MKDEYIIINKTEVLKRIEELENEIDSDNYSGRTCDIFLSKIEILKQILSQSAPLIPEIEKAFDSSWFKAHGVMANKEKEKQDYISNLKLDI